MRIRDSIKGIVVAPSRQRQAYESQPTAQVVRMLAADLLESLERFDGCTSCKRNARQLAQHRGVSALGYLFFETAPR